MWSFFIGMAMGTACTSWGIWLERRRWSRRMVRDINAAMISTDEAHWSPEDDE